MLIVTWNEIFRPAGLVSGVAGVTLTVASAVGCGSEYEFGGGCGTRNAYFAAVSGLRFLGLVRPRMLDYGDLVEFQQRALGLLQSDDRVVVGRLELGLLGHGLGILADRVEVSVDRDPAFLVVARWASRRCNAAALSRFAVWYCL